MTEKACVYVVDDDGAVRDSLEFLLRSRNIPVHLFASAQTFLDAYDPGWRGCLLLDVRMPGIDGRHLLTTLTKRKCALPIIMMTAHADVAMAVEAMKKGATDFLEKPLDPTRLLARIRELMDERPRPDGVDSDLLARYDSLSPREKQVMALVLRGLANKNVAYELNISARTVELHRARVMSKMGVSSLPALARCGLALGLEVD